ncbi:MAG TPA: DUF6335 family protein [Vicinamibacterales bacterium]
MKRPKKAGAKSTGKARARSKPSARKAKASARKARPARKTAASRRDRQLANVGKRPQLDRARRTLDDIVPTPPSSLNLDRRSSAAKSGRAEMEDSLKKHGTAINPGLTGGDVDADFENAYFSGDEAPGGDNPTPDQDVVEDIGRALGIEYNDNEELKSGDKLTKRDKHRWELDPASSEDYKDRE